MFYVLYAIFITDRISDIGTSIRYVDLLVDWLVVSLLGWLVGWLVGG